MTARDQDWTLGPAKWAAVLVMGACSIAGMTWSIVGRQPRPLYSPAIVARPAPPSAEAPAGPSRSSDAVPVTPQDEAHAIPPSVARTIDLNTATAAELELLPGIGPGLAARIIEHRRAHGPFKSVDELDNVSGIGPRTLEKVRAHAVVR